MVPPRSPLAARFSSSLPLSHSVIRPTTGSGVGPNSVELASAMPSRLRAASITAICMPKQMPKYGTWRSRANCAARILPSAPRWPKPPGTRMPLTCSRNGAGSSLLEHLGLDPVEVDLHLVGDAAVRQRLDQRLVGVLHAGVLADDGDGDLAFRIADALVDELPARQVGRLAGIEAERVQHFACRAPRRDRPPAPRRCCRRRAPRSPRSRARCRTATSLRRSSFGIVAVGAAQQDVGLDADRAAVP